MDSKKQLILFTISFPFGKGEEFLELEVEYLSKAFERIILVPYKPNGTECRSLPENVQVKRLDLNVPGVKKVGILLNALPTFFKWLVKGFSYSRNKKGYLKRPFWSIKLIVHRIVCASIISDNFSISPNTIFYSYWFYTWGSVLAMMRSRNRNMKYLVRIHSSDYDAKESKVGYFPFRSLEMHFVQSLAPIADYAKNYIEKHFPSFKGVNEVSRLGVKDHDAVNPIHKPDELVLVSCSFVHKVKRVDLIIDILKQYTSTIKWVHFGDGDLFPQIKEQAAKLPKNVIVELKGYVENSKVFDYYRTNQVDFFINTSSNEGVPVSIMEAISFGIPVIACDVGGNAEIATKQSGHLIPEELDPLEVANIIRNYAKLNLEQKHKKRKEVKAFWLDNYSASLNYVRFIERLKNL